MSKYTWWNGSHTGTNYYCNSITDYTCYPICIFLLFIYFYLDNMLIYHAQWQDIEDQDVIQISSLYYIVAYDIRICTFVLYPLGGHSLQTLHVWFLSEPHIDWTWVWNIHDVLDKAIKVDSEFQVFADNIQWGLDQYLEYIKQHLSI